MWSGKEGTLHTEIGEMPDSCLLFVPRLCLTIQNASGQHSICYPVLLEHCAPMVVYFDLQNGWKPTWCVWCFYGMVLKASGEHATWCVALRLQSCGIAGGSI